MSIKGLWEAAAASGNNEARSFLNERMSALEEEWCTASTLTFDSYREIGEEEGAEAYPENTEDVSFAIEIENEDIPHLLESLDKTEGPVELTDRQSALFRALAAVRPDPYLSSLAKWLGLLGDNLARAGRVPDAVECLSEAIDRATEMDDSERDRWIGQLAWHRGRLLLALHRLDEALADLREALRATPPGSENAIEMRDEFVDVLDMIAMALLQGGRNSEALPYLEERAGVSRQIALGDGRKLADFAVALSRVGAVGVDHAPESAEAALIECVQIRRVLAASDPTSYRPLLAIALNNLGDFYRRRGDLAGARIHLVEAIDIRRPLAVSDPETYGFPLVRTLNNLYLALLAANATEELLTHTDKSCQLLLALADANVGFLTDYCHTLLFYAEIRAEARRELDQALRSVEIAIKLAERLPSGRDIVERAMTLRKQLLAITRRGRHGRP